MDNERRRRAEELFHRANALRADERARFLDEQCPRDPELRAEVEGLLSTSETRLGSFMHAPLLDATRLSPGGVHGGAPQRIGDYEIVREIGRGGMGIVYEARQARPHRTVALKVIKPELVSDELLRRFQHEAELLGHLQHPGIAHIYEASFIELAAVGGVVSRRPYFAMELIHGVPLDEYACSTERTNRDRLELIIRVCDAVHYAHQHGVIHRDLKPENILVDASGQPKILDFGVARAVGPDLLLTTVRTCMGELVGTLPYMSPEQLSGDPRQLDTRSDVYALGVLCYEVLAGRLPFDLRDKVIAEAVRIIQQDEPTRLSSVSRLLRGDLETVVAKALEKDRTRRYPSASEFAADIQRYLNDEPISARPPSAVYQLRKLIKRNRGLAAAILASFLILLAGSIVSTSLAINEAQQRHLASEAETRARQRQAEAEAARREEQRQREVAELATVQANERAERLRQVLYANRIASAQQSYADAQIQNMLPPLYACAADLRGWEWYWLVALSKWRGLSLATSSRLVTAVAFSPNGQQIAAADGTIVHLWDATTGVERKTLDGHRLDIVAVAFTADSERLISGSRDGTVIMWDIAGHGRTETYGQPRGPGEEAAATFSADGQRIAIAGKDDTTIMMLPAGTPIKLPKLATHGMIDAVVFSSAGDRVALTRDLRGSVRICDANTGQQIHTLVGGGGLIWCAAFSPDGQFLAAGCADGKLNIWSVTSGELAAVLRGHAGMVRAVAYSPDGSRVVSGGSDGTVRVWDAASARLIRTLAGHQGAVLCVGFSPDGERIVSGGEDELVKVWDAAPTSDSVTFRTPTSATDAIAFSLDGLRVAYRCDPDLIKVADTVTGTELISMAGMKSVLAVAFSPDGTRIGIGDTGGSFRLLDARTGAAVNVQRRGGQAVAAVAFDPTGRLLAWGSTDVEIWHAANGQPFLNLGRVSGTVNTLVFSPDGIYVAATTSSGDLKLWNVTNRGEVELAHEPWKHALTPVFGADGTRIASGGDDGTVLIWDTHSGALSVTIETHLTAVNSLAFSPDGDRLLSASDGMKVWDTSTGSEIRTLRGHLQRIGSVAFSPDGKRIASASFDHSVKIWNALTGQELLTLRIDEVANHIAFSPDGSRIMASGLRGAAVWQASTKAEFELDPRTVDQLARSVELLESQTAADEAEPLLIEALQISDAIYGNKATQTNEIRIRLGGHHTEAGRYQEAEQLLLKAEELVAERGNLAAAKVAKRAMAELVRLYEAWGQAEQAAKWRDKLAATEPSPGPAPDN